MLSINPITVPQLGRESEHLPLPVAMLIIWPEGHDELCPVVQDAYNEQADIYFV